MDTIQRTKLWLKANYKFVIVILLLIFLAVASLGYAFLREGNLIKRPESVPEPVAVHKFEHMALAEPEPADDTSGTAAGTNGVTLGDRTRCLDNDSALAAVNLKIQKETKTVEELEKKVGIGGVVNEIAKSTNRLYAQHQSILEQLKREFEQLLGQLDC